MGRRALTTTAGWGTVALATIMISLQPRSTVTRLAGFLFAVGEWVYLGEHFSIPLFSIFDFPNNSAGLFRRTLVA
jgi:hypothetical protein